MKKKLLKQMLDIQSEQFKLYCYEIIIIFILIITIIIIIKKKSIGIV